jgi:hypothetical protein
MTFGKYINELLYRYECVTIPNFGAFLTRSVGVLIHYDMGVFNPPKKVLTFNSLLKTNDGILAHHIAQRQNISYESALRLIEKEIIIWKQKLQTQPLIIDPIGELRLNASKRVEFLTYANINFDTNAYGLNVFTRKPLAQTPRNNPAKTFSIMPENEKDNLMFTPDNEAQKTASYPLLKYAAIGIIALGLTGASYYFGGQYINNERVKNQQIAQEKISETVATATFDLGKLDAVSLTIGVAAPKTNTVLEQPYFSVVAGTYRDFTNAERVLNSLKRQGYEAAFTAVNPEGMHRVAYGRFTNKREAIKLLYFIKYTLKEDAWYLEEK